MRLRTFLKLFQLLAIPGLSTSKKKASEKKKEAKVPGYFNVSKNERRLILELQDYFSKNDRCCFSLSLNSISGMPAVLITMQVNSNPLPSGMVKLLDQFKNHVQPN